MNSILKEIKDLEPIPYDSVIEAYGGPTKVADFIESRIDPKIKALESPVVIPKLYVRLVLVYYIITNQRYSQL